MRVVQVFLTLLLALDSAAVWASPPTIPREFRGEWNQQVAQCGKGEDDSYLYLDARRVSFWESFGPVRAAVARGNNLALILELSEEAETWLTTAQFELSADGTKLISAPGTEEEFVRYRCPPKATRPNNSFKPNLLRGSA
jgi:hypothetical protein